MSKQAWKITGDCVYEEMCDNGVVPKQRVICYMHPDATAKDRHLVTNAPKLLEKLRQLFGILDIPMRMDTLIDVPLNVINCMQDTYNLLKQFDK